MTEWSPQQALALQRVNHWLESGDEPVFQLAGFAGTGKTTLAKHLAEGVKGRVYFAAYTGKAAHVLTKSGAPNVSTIHKLIYVPKDKSKKRLMDLEAERKALMTHDPIPKVMIAKVEAAILAERNNLSRPMFALNTESDLIGAKLLVVDEYSMIDQQMGEDLLSFGCKILALGDPGQLPPVRGVGFFRRDPDILLTEIHRQAQDNPIIWMSKEVREGRDLSPGRYGDSTVARYALAKPDLAAKVLSTDQLLVGRNVTRASSNTRARQLLGRADPLPRSDDKLVCLRNNHEIGLLNGQIWTVLQDSVFDGEYVVMNIEGDEGAKLDVIAHADYFHGKVPDSWSRRDAEEFDYGYALTVHKSQGSQWSDVLLLDEWYGKDRRQWLYTAITRAAERIDIVQM